MKNTSKPLIIYTLINGLKLINYLEQGQAENILGDLTQNLQ